MSYKIAVATSDGVNVDLHFGAAEYIEIYEVQDDKSFSLLEKRNVTVNEESSAQPASCDEKNAGCSSGGCGNGNGSGNGCGGGSGSAKVEAVADVRAVVAARIGFNVTKQLEKKAIASFDVECPVKEALEKISGYFYSIDNHLPFARK